MGSSSSSRSEPPKRILASSSRRRSPPDNAPTGGPVLGEAEARDDRAGFRLAPVSADALVVVLEPREPRDVFLRGQLLEQEPGLHAPLELDQPAGREEVLDPGRAIVGSVLPRILPEVSDGAPAPHRPGRRGQLPGEHGGRLGPFRPTTPTLSPAARTRSRSRTTVRPPASTASPATSRETAAPRRAGAVLRVRAAAPSLPPGCEHGTTGARPVCSRRSR